MTASDIGANDARQEALARTNPLFGPRKHCVPEKAIGLPATLPDRDGHFFPEHPARDYAADQQRCGRRLWQVSADRHEREDVDDLRMLAENGVDVILLTWPAFIDDMTRFRDEVHPLLVEEGLR